jgi:hypothetical protein
VRVVENPLDRLAGQRRDAIREIEGRVVFFGD